jgi:putative resolvase
VRLKERAGDQGIAYRTALTWFNAGRLPVAARQLPAGTMLVDLPPRAAGRTVAYCRVSSADQRSDLDRQAGRVVGEYGRRGVSLNATVTEVGSGLNGSLVRLRTLLAGSGVTVIVVEHPGRLARFGVEHLQAVLSATGHSIMVLDPDEFNDDLVRDLVEVLTSMCARLCGRPPARKRADAAVRAAESNP